MNPMFLVYKPPQMLPTKVLNRIGTPTGSSKLKRGLSMLHPDGFSLLDPDCWSLVGLIMVISGGIIFIVSI